MYIYVANYIHVYSTVHYVSIASYMIILCYYKYILIAMTDIMDIPTTRPSTTSATSSPAALSGIYTYLYICI